MTRKDWKTHALCTAIFLLGYATSACGLWYLAFPLGVLAGLAALQLECRP